MELRLVGLERDGASVSVARFGQSLESGQGPSKQGPALGMLGVAIKTCLQLLNRGGDFSRIVASGGSYSGRRVYRRGCADREVDGKGSRRQQAGYSECGADAPRKLGRIDCCEIRSLGFPIGFGQ